MQTHHAQYRLSADLIELGLCGLRQDDAAGRLRLRQNATNQDAIEQRKETARLEDGEGEKQQQEDVSQCLSMQHRPVVPICHRWGGSAAKVLEFQLV
jgi:hypothetical protein